MQFNTHHNVLQYLVHYENDHKSPAVGYYVLRTSPFGRWHTKSKATIYLLMTFNSEVTDSKIIAMGYYLVHFEPLFLYISHYKSVTPPELQLQREVNRLFCANHAFTIIPNDYTEYSIPCETTCS